MILQVDVSKKLSGFDCRAAFELRNDRCGIFGPSGSGKSTLVSMLSGLLRPDRGQIILNGENLFDSSRRLDLPPEKRRIGVVFQHAHLFPHLSVRKNLLYGWKRTDYSKRRLDPEALINILDLTPLINRGVGSLSGGECQRVALARTILACPRLVLMDEPLTGLDEKLKYQIIPYLKRVFAEFDIPFLFISHSIQELRLLTEDVLTVAGGTVQERLPVEQLARQHLGNGNGNRGYANLLSLHEPRHQGDLWMYRWGDLELTATEPGAAGENIFELGAKDITLFKKNPEATSARNLITCRVSSLFGEGNRIGVELTCPGGRLVSQIVQESVRQLELCEGTEVTAVIKASALRKLY